MLRRSLKRNVLLLAASLLTCEGAGISQTPPPLPGPITPTNYSAGPDQAGSRGGTALTPAVLPTPTASTGGASVSVSTIGPPSISPGHPLPFEIIVRNAWTMNASQLRVELPLPAGARFLAGQPAPEIAAERVTWIVGNLEPGAERRLKGELFPAPGQEISLSPTVSYTAPGNFRTRIVKPPFSLTLSSPETGRIGQPIALNMQIANASTDRIRAVVANVKVPHGLRHPAGPEVEADVGDLAPGQERSLTLEVVPTKSGNFTIEAIASSQDGKRALGNTWLAVADTAEVLKARPPQTSAPGTRRAEETPNLVLDLSNSDDALEIGQENTVEMRLLNQGGAATDVRTVALVPDGFVALRADGPSQARIDGQRVTFEPLGQLPVRAEALYRVHVRAVQAGHWQFRADVSAVGLGRLVREELSTQVGVKP